MSIAKRRILVVTADSALGQAITEQLELIEGTEPVPCGSASVALQSLGSGPVNAVITDFELPDASGSELCSRLRRQGIAAPLIMLVPPDAAAAGIDHVVKPFRLGTLMTRLNALIEKEGRRGAGPVAIGPLNFHPESRTLVHRHDGRRQRLTEKEAQILNELLRAGGSTVDRGTLLDRVWGYDKRIETHTLETHIWRLRRKIEQDSSNARILLKAPGGYRLQP